jgi:hypothetical protein
MTNQWFRSWHGAPTDPKWLGIARKAGVAPGIVAAVVWALLDRASQASERGSIAGYDADGIACFMGCEPEQVSAVVALMHEKGILADDAFTGWEKHQPRREDNSNERVKEHRERKKTQRNAGVTQCNADETPGNAMERPETLDTDTDTDTEREKEKERAHSQDPRHWKVVQDILAARSGEVTDWELDFLHSVKWTPSLTAAQSDSLKGIINKLGDGENKPYALPSVKRGTPQYDAWIAYYRKSNGRSTFYEKLDAITVPTEYPPQEQAA